MQKNKFLFFHIFVTVSILLSIAYLEHLSTSWKEKIRVKKISIRGNITLQKNEILNFLDIENDSLLFSMSDIQFEKNVLRNLWVKNVKVEKNISFSEIQIKIEERKPIAMCVKNEIIYFDEDGFVMPQLEEREFLFPIINIQNDIIKKNCLSKKYENALKLLSIAKKDFPNTYEFISEIRVKNNGDVIVNSIENAVPIYFGKGNEASQLKNFYIFWSKVLKGKTVLDNIEFIDARFENEIVVKWKT